jgi:hypothetical protein
MAEPDFEATWYPRIGKDAAEELRRGRRITIFGISSPLFAAGASLLIGNGTLEDIIGIAMAAVVVVYLVMFIDAQRRLAAAMSDWFGVKIKGTPKMTPRRFDTWSQARGLHRPTDSLTSGEKGRHPNSAL